MQTKEVFIGGYQVRGNYDYVGDLESNYIYDNRTKFYPGDGVLYSLITNYIDFSFSYGFNSKPVSINKTIYGDVSFLIESDKKWNKTLNKDDAQNMFSLSNEEDRFSFRVIPSNIIEYVENIDKDIGVNTENFTIYVNPYINTRTSIGGIYIDNVFEPNLKIEFKEVSKSDLNMDVGKCIIISEDLTQSKAFPVTQIVNMRNQNVDKYRKYSLFLFIIILLVTFIETYISREYLRSFITSLNNRKNHAIGKKSQSENFHNERIIKASNESKDISRKYTLNSLDDLVNSGRYSNKKFEIFYVKEGNTIYEYIYSYTIINDNPVSPHNLHEDTILQSVEN
jgi:hypothetical protein